jgi:hypothetical protein
MNKYIVIHLYVFDVIVHKKNWKVIIYKQYLLKGYDLKTFFYFLKKYVQWKFILVGSVSTIYV